VAIHKRVQRKQRQKLQGHLEKTLYKLVQTENRKMNIRLKLRKYVLPIKISLKKRKTSIIIWDWTQLKEI